MPALLLPPVREVWIEIVRMTDDELAAKLPPVREVWIEIFICGRRFIKQAVLPPVREVWIEIKAENQMGGKGGGYLPYGRCGLKCQKPAPL